MRPAPSAVVARRRLFPRRGRRPLCLVDEFIAFACLGLSGIALSTVPLEYLGCRAVRQGDGVLRVSAGNCR